MIHEGALSIIYLLGFWKLAELLWYRLIQPLDRWQERQQVTRNRRAGWNVRG